MVDRLKIKLSEERNQLRKEIAALKAENERLQRLDAASESTFAAWRSRAIKALEWNDEGWGVLAYPEIGEYRIEDQGKHWTDDRYWFSYSGHVIRKFRDLDEAKAAAQADYERRVLACLTTEPAAPEGQQEAVAWRYRWRDGGDWKLSFHFDDGLDPAKYEQEPLFTRPAEQAVTEAMVEYRYRLQWTAAPRPPVHPTPMEGSQTFPTLAKAVGFMQRQANDSQFVSLTEIRTSSTDRSDDARTALKAAMEAGRHE